MNTLTQVGIGIVLLLVNCLAVFSQGTIDNSIRDGGEYHLYNVYYGKVLGGNAENDSRESRRINWKIDGHDSEFF